MTNEVFEMLKKSLGELICEKFDIPLECLSSTPLAQITGNSLVSIDGCVGIKKYETDEIIIRTKDYILTVKGSELSMITFSQGRVSIRGEIASYSIESV